MAVAVVGLRLPGLLEGVRGRVIGRRSRHRPEQEGEKGRGGRLGAAEQGAARAERGGDQPEQDGRQQEPREPLDLPAGDGFILVPGFQLAQVVAVQVAQVHAGRAHRHIHAAGPGGDGVKGGGIQLAVDFRALVRHAPAVGLGNGASRGAAEPDGENGDAPLAGFCDGLVHGAGQILAVGDQHDRLVGALLEVEGVQRLPDGVPDIGLAGRGGVGRRRVQDLEEERVIGGERADGYGLVAEQDQARAVAPEAGHQVQQVGLGALQPVGGGVGRQHGAGDVEHDHEIAPAAGDLVLDFPVLGTGQRDEGQREPEAEEGQLDAEEPAAAGRQLAPLHLGGDKGAGLLPPAGPPPGEPEGRQRDQPEQGQHPGMDEG